jgi:hypothetical protein
MLSFVLIGMFYLFSVAVNEYFERRSEQSLDTRAAEIVAPMLDAKMDLSEPPEDLFPTL